MPHTSSSACRLHQMLQEAASYQWRASSRRCFRRSRTPPSTVESCCGPSSMMTGQLQLRHQELRLICTVFFILDVRVHTCACVLIELSCKNSTEIKTDIPTTHWATHHPMFCWASVKLNANQVPPYLVLGVHWDNLVMPKTDGPLIKFAEKKKVRRESLLEYWVHRDHLFKFFIN